MYFVELAQMNLPPVVNDEATKDLPAFTSKSVIGAWRHRYKESLEILKLGGLSSEGSLAILDPYTSVERREDFSGIWEHNLAVGFVCSVLSEWLLSAKLITPEEREAIIVHGQTHDATKPFEIFRTRFFHTVKLGLAALEEEMKNSGSVVEAMGQGLISIQKKENFPEAVPHYARALVWFCIRRGWLEGAGILRLEPSSDFSFPSVELDLELIAHDPLYTYLEHTPDAYEAHRSLERALLGAAYPLKVRSALMESCGFGCSPQSMRELFLISEDRKLSAGGNWIQKVVFLADNMTATPVANGEVKVPTYFVTTRERQTLTKLAERYPTLLNRGIGFKDGIRQDDMIFDPSTEAANECVSLLKVQWFLSEHIAAELAQIHTGRKVETPSSYLKEQVNLALQALI